MLSRTRKVAAVVSLVGAASIGGAIGARAAHAGSAADTDDSLSNKGAVVTMSLSDPTSTPLVLNVMSNAFGNFTQTCETFSGQFTVPASGLSTSLTRTGSPPQPFQLFCADSLAGTKFQFP